MTYISIDIKIIPGGPYPGCDLIKGCDPDLNQAKNLKNKLRNEKSPYLLQHAGNPVNWYPWGNEAFVASKEENKPIFLSIGYSTCHWCHVMEKESFEDGSVAEMMNRVFINIKVDREERPDIDKIYMTVAQMMTGSGGWPLTIIMTPEKKPFFSGTYIPRQSQPGRMGMLELIPRIEEIWNSKKGEILDSAEKITSKILEFSNAGTPAELDGSILEEAFLALHRTFDSKYGGFGDSPKFPTAHNLIFLLNYWKKTGNDKAIQMVEKTLTSMREGGIWDHIGMGFHRYSTDRKWILPHFEKMLYDQALGALAYTDAFGASGKIYYKETAVEILKYVSENMKSGEGGFYSAQDADSEGEEGTFYVWDINEIESLFSKEEAGLIIEVFNIKREGNYLDQATGEQTGKNIFYLSKSLDLLAVELNTTRKILEQKLEKARSKLNDQREKRIHPFKDDKILTDWNGLMISAFARAARVFNIKEYEKTAEEAIGFIFKKMFKEDGSLCHRYREGQADFEANLDDYAFLIMALLELYETGFKTDHLKKAIKLNNTLIKHFWDSTNGGFYFTSDKSEKLISRQKESYDGAIPSGNSVSMFNLAKLSRITGDRALEEKALKIADHFSGIIKNSPSSHTYMLAALSFIYGPAYEVFIVGKKDSTQTLNIIRAINSNYIPNKIIVFKPSDEKDSEIDKISDFSRNLKLINGKTTVYVCKNYYCKLPTNDAGKMLELLND